MLEDSNKENHRRSENVKKSYGSQLQSLVDLLKEDISNQLKRFTNLHCQSKVYLFFIYLLLEPQIVDYLFMKDKKMGHKEGNSKLKDEVMKILSVQKQTAAGQRTRFKAVVITGDEDGHIGVGVKVAKEVQFAIKGALVNAKLNLVPVRRGYWGAKLGSPHTVAQKITGKCGSVRVRLIPAPHGTAIVGAPITKKILLLAGVKDCYTSTTGKSRTAENFIKATCNALERLYKVLTPDLWKIWAVPEHPYSKFADKADELKKTFAKEKAEHDEKKNIA